MRDWQDWVGGAITLLLITIVTSLLIWLVVAGSRVSSDFHAWSDSCYARGGFVVQEGDGGRPLCESSDRHILDEW